MSCTEISSQPQEMNPNAGENDSSVNGGWPCLFQEIVEMILAAIGTFALTDLRALALKGKLVDGSERVIDLPVTYGEVIDIMKRNESVYRRTKSGDFVDLVDAYHDIAEEAELEKQWGTVHYVGDENSSQECVYAIYTSARRKRIVLAFRGSITLNDWLKDAKTVIGTIPNPVATLSSDQPETVGIHLGFRDYLYGEGLKVPKTRSSQSSLDTSEQESELSTDDNVTHKKESMLDKIPPLPHVLPVKLPPPLAMHKLSSSKSDENDDNDSKKDEETKKTKLETILEQVQTLMDEHPDYRVYITGHSLGGALALCAALETAAKLGSKECPVTCIAIGNPKTGDSRFRSAIELLEQRGMLRCLGVRNKLDVVPALPDHIITGSKNFCHVGLELFLFSNGYRIVRKGDESDNVWNKISYDFQRDATERKAGFVNFFTDRLNKHNYREYYERILAQREELQELHLNDIYREKLDASLF